MVNWAIIGCGDVADKRVADAIKKAKGSSLKAAVRRNKEKLEEFANKHGVPNYYTDVETMLNPVSVIASADNIHKDYMVEDTASAIIKFKGGSHGILNCSFSVPHGNQIEFYGTKGKIITNSIDDSEFMVIDCDDKVTRYSLPKEDNVCVPLIEDFVDAIKNNRVPFIDGSKGIQASKVIEGLYISSNNNCGYEIK